MNIQDPTILFIISFICFFDSIRDSNGIYSYMTLSSLSKKLANTSFCKFLSDHIYTTWDAVQWSWHIIKWLATYPISITLTIVGLSNWYLWIVSVVLAWLSFRFGTYVSGGKFFGSWFLK